MTAILTENSHAKRDSPNYSIVWKRTCNIPVDPCSIHVHSCAVRYTSRGIYSLTCVKINMLKKILEY